MEVINRVLFSNYAIFKPRTCDVPLWTEEPSVLSFFKYLWHQSVSVSIVGRAGFSAAWFHTGCPLYIGPQLSGSIRRPGHLLDTFSVWLLSLSYGHVCAVPGGVLVHMLTRLVSDGLPPRTARWAKGRQWIDGEEVCVLEVFYFSFMLF